ncbi:MAG: hypothetical protein ACRBDL_06260 [Alphaproteobacteria bacterium]
MIWDNTPNTYNRKNTAQKHSSKHDPRIIEIVRSFARNAAEKAYNDAIQNTLRQEQERHE